MRRDPVKRLQAYVEREYLVEDPHRLYAVRKMPAGVLEIEPVEQSLAGVREGRVADVVPERDRLDQIEVEIEGVPYRPRDPRD